MANTKEDFYSWVKIRYPGYWAEDMDTIDWTKPPYSTYIEEWQAAGFPAEATPGTQPFVPEGNGDFWEGATIEVPDKVVKKIVDGKEVYYDFLSQQVMNAGTALEMISAYRRSLMAGEGDALGREQLAFQREQFEWQKQQGSPEEQRAIDAAKWEKMRQELLTTLGDPEDWIAKWELEHKPNPYEKAEQQKGRILYDFEVAEGEQIGPNDVVIADSLKEAVSLGASQWIPKKDIKSETLTQNLRNLLQNRAEGFLQGTDKDIFQMARKMSVPMTGGLGSPGVTGLGGQSIPQAATSPNAPYWLQQFAPGQRTGQPITQEQMAAPSAQQIARTGPDVLAGLSGFAKFSGQSFQDLLHQTNIMLPQDPTKKGRTTPISQR